MPKITVQVAKQRYARLPVIDPDTGEHHSYLLKAEGYDHAMGLAKIQYRHVTRVEAVPS